MVRSCSSHFQSLAGLISTGAYLPTSVTKFRHFDNILKALGDYVLAYLELGNHFNMLWSTFYAIGQIFIAANGLILTNNLIIWSRCYLPTDIKECKSTYLG